MKKKEFIADFLAGLSVSFAALALGAAFGVMSGRGAFAGMIAAGVIPILTGLFGGTRLSVSGPTGPMTAVSSVVIAFAYDNFKGDKQLAEQFVTLVFLLLSVFLLIAALLRTGKYIKFVPQVVILGFMSGIAMVIWVDQIKILFGLDGKTPPEGALTSNLLIALVTFVLIMVLPLILKKLRVPKSVSAFIPSVLSSIVLMTIFTSLVNLELGKINLGASHDNLSEFFAHLATYFPSERIFTTEYIFLAIPYALQLTLLGYLDSLLTALIMDHLTNEKSNMNKELFGQGLSNGAAAIFQGIPGAQATIRSVLLYKEGAKTRLGAVSAGIFVLIAFLLFKDYVGLVLSAVFIGVLFKAALDVFEKDFLRVYFQRRWFTIRRRNIQFFFIVYTMLVTAFVDLNIAVVTGTLFFYMGRKVFRFSDIESDFASQEPPTNGNGHGKESVDDREFLVASSATREEKTFER